MAGTHSTVLAAGRPDWEIGFKQQGQGKGISGLWMAHGCCCLLVFDPQGPMQSTPFPSLLLHCSLVNKAPVLPKIASLPNSSWYQDN